ncbi:MAG: hypothetical protein KZQ80_04745 [Candidatus Thiodiazotropha sp. (ex Monitilora ramsayi)]|nr:hypothetical protein [Candidatus Thiodiazotropha sp. (ex Monitilora ramsayi)]
MLAPLNLSVSSQTMTNETNKFLEATLEGAEVIADSLIENELIKSIPIVGTALKLISGSLDLRDKIFLSKVQRFILEIESISNEERLKFKQNISSDEELMATVGEASLLVLDKLSDLKKADLLGFYFSCFLGGHLDQYQYRRITAAIDTAFIDDIEKLLESGANELLSQKQFMESLLSSGITVISAGTTIDSSGELFYELTSMGSQMIELWQEYKQS